MKRDCKRCKTITLHQGNAPELVAGPTVMVVFQCLVCGAIHRAEVGKNLYFDRPPTKFFCEGCEGIRDHEVSNFGCGKRVKRVYVLHCKECNREVRRSFKRGERIPREFVAAERRIKLAKRLA